jgi:hypothetical protein
VNEGCCSDQSPQRRNCPDCHGECRQVAISTMLHQLEAPWERTLTSAAYYYCGNRNCDTFYFDGKGSRYRSAALRRESREALQRDVRCFCYGVTGKQAENNPAIRDFIVEQTRNKACACESRNPSGRCCLKELPH